jgi:hypothetical protein
MMNQVPFRLSLFVLFLATFLSCETEGPESYKNHFIKYYGGDGDQEAKDFVINSDGTVVMLGTSYETNGDTRMYVVKSDIEGNQLWAVKIGSTAESAQDIELITNGPDIGKLVLLSNVKKNEADSTAIRLTIINQAGDSLTSKLFDYLESQRAESVTALSDGGYYVVGNTTDTDAGKNVGINPDFEDELMIKFGSNWDNYTLDQLGQSSIASGVKVFQSGTEFYYAGYWDAVELPGGNFESNFLFRKFTDNPNSVGTLYVGAKDENEFLTSIAKAANGNFLAVGTKVTTTNTIVASRISSNFQNASSMRSIISDAEAVSVSPSGSADFLIVGNEIGVGNIRNICLIKVDGNGEEIFKTRFGASNNDDTASAVLELSNGDILVLGTMELVNQKKMALIKIKPNGSF